MKRAMMLFVVMAVVLAAVFAEGEGVTLVSSPGSNSEKGSLEDMQLNQEVKVDGFGRITLTEAKEVDEYKYYIWAYSSASYKYSSGVEANYFYLTANVLNTNTQAFDYLKKCSVRAYYDERFVYSGWEVQYDWDGKSGNDGKINMYAKDKRQPIRPMYTGHYGFFVELPNAVLNDTAPLKIVVKMDDVEFTYYVRK